MYIAKTTSQLSLPVANEDVYFFRLILVPPKYRLLTGENYQESEFQTSTLPMICPRNFYF